MQRRRSPAKQRTRTATLAGTPRAQITYFPKRVVTSGAQARADTIESLPAITPEITPLSEPARTPADPIRRQTPVGPDRDALAYHRGKLEKLLRGDRRALEGLDAQGLMSVAIFGHGLYEDGRLNEARVVFEGLVSMDPQEAFPYTVLGAIYLAQQDLHRALALFEAALELDVDDPAALVYRGEIRLELGQRERGIADLKRALAVDPEGSRSPFSVRARQTLRQANAASVRH